MNQIAFWTVVVAAFQPILLGLILFTCGLWPEGGALVDTGGAVEVYRACAH